VFDHLHKYCAVIARDNFILPTFLNPPVVETVLAVQFNSIEGFTNAHLGAFWKSLGSEWPTVADAAPIPEMFERFGNEQLWEWNAFELRFSTQPANRLRITNAAGDRMIQVQNGKFCFNWLKQGTGKYPRFDSVCPVFNHIFAKFKEFVEAEGLDSVTPNQWEITYVNQILKGNLWQVAAEWPDIIGGFMPTRKTHPDVEVESMGRNGIFISVPNVVACI
jgi:uncharacterized protein (TIGR04255 family)